MRRSITLFVICSQLVFGCSLLSHITKETIEGDILRNEFRYSNGSHDQQFKQRWREGMIKCLDRKRNTIELECVFDYVHSDAKKDNPDAG